jgi:hypothetical protein
MKKVFLRQLLVFAVGVLAAVCLLGTQSAWASYGSIVVTGTSASMHFNSTSGKWLSNWHDNVTATITVTGSTTDIVSIAQKLSWDTDWVTRSENSNTASVVITPDWAGYYVCQWTVSYADGMVISAAYLFNTWRLSTEPDGVDHTQKGDKLVYCNFLVCYDGTCVGAFGTYHPPCPPNECSPYGSKC